MVLCTKAVIAFLKCNKVTLNGQEVIDIDMSTSNEPDCEATKYSNPPLHVVFVPCFTVNYSSKAHN